MTSISTSSSAVAFSFLRGFVQQKHHHPPQLLFLHRSVEEEVDPGGQASGVVMDEVARQHQDHRRMLVRVQPSNRAAEFEAVEGTLQKAVHEEKVHVPFRGGRQRLATVADVEHLDGGRQLTQMP